MTLKLEHLYFIAIVPPDDISGQITAIKDQMYHTYKSRHALRSPPHITLHMPFKWKESKKDLLFYKLKAAAQQLKPFEVQLDGFDVFEPRVLFVNVRASQALDTSFEVVKNKMRELHLLNAQYKDRPFHPHITVAFRDLKKEMFYAAWKEYQEKKYKAFFDARELILFKHIQEKGKQPVWKIHERFLLSSS